MKITYITTRKDLEAWHAHCFGRSETKKRLRIQKLTIAVSMSLIIFVLALYSTKDVWLSSAPAILLFFVIYASYYSVQKHESLKAYLRRIEQDQHSPALGTHTLEISPTGITEQSTAHTVASKWETVSRIEMTQDHIFIVLSSLGAYIVPNASFGSSAEQESFVKELQSNAPGKLQPTG